MKIAILLEDYTQMGGVEKVTANLSQAFLEEKIPIWGILSLETKNEISKIHFPPHIKIISLKNKRLETIIKENKITHIIVQVQNIDKAISIVQKARTINVHIISILHNTPYLYTNYFLGKSTLKDKIKYYGKKIIKIKNKYFFKKILQYSNHFLMVSKEAKKEMIEIMGKDFNNLDYNYNIIPELKENNQTNYLQEKQNIILYAGRLSRDKRVLETVKNLHLLLKNHPDWQYHILGEGQEKQKIQEYIKENNIDNIKLFGTVNNVEEHLKKSKICILYSLFEGLPTILLEAAMYQNVLISFKSKGGVVDIIENESNGYIVKDSQEFLDKIQYLINNKEKIKTMAMNNKTIIAKINYKKIIEKWKKILNI